MTQLGPRLARVLVLVVLVLSIAGAATSVASPAAAGLTQQTTPANNTTVQHEDPATVSQTGDSQQVSRWLQSRLTRQLEGSAVNISEGQYEQAQAELGDDYDDRLEQYVTVAGDTDSEADDRTAQRLNQTQRDQRALANDTQSYNETFREYQAARAAGNTTAARAAARDLETLSERIDRRNGSLNRNYEQLENETGVDTDPTRNAITNTSRDVQAQQDEVRAETFTRTQLTVTTNGSTVAFDDPMAIEGRVTTLNGTAVAAQTVPITVGNRTYEPRTDAEGRFTVSYRPVSIPVNATTVAIAYRPRGGSPYLGTETTARVDVTQVTPELNADVTPTTAGYRTPLTTTVTATADGRRVPGLTLRSRLGGTVQRGQTNAQGRTALSPTVPARVPTGEQSLHVSHSREGIAVGPAATATPVTITATPTTATVSATVEADALRIDGRLLTEGTQPVTGQSVDVRVGGQSRTVTTNATGGYTLTVTDLSRVGAANASTIPVTVQFDGIGTNLDSTEASTTASIPQADTNANGSTLIQRPLLAGIALLGLVLVVGAIVWSRSEPAAADTPATESTTTDVTTATETGDQAETWLDQAGAALSAEEFERAVVASYASMRGYLQAREGIDDALTHREFVTATQNRLSDTDQPSIQTVADAYEQVVFAGAVDTADATAAVEAAVVVRQRSERE